MLNIIILIKGQIFRSLQTNKRRCQSMSRKKSHHELPSRAFQQSWHSWLNFPHLRPSALGISSFSIDNLIMSCWDCLRSPKSEGPQAVLWSCLHCVTLTSPAKSQIWRQLFWSVNHMLPCINSLFACVATGFACTCSGFCRQTSCMPSPCTDLWKSAPICVRLEVNVFESKVVAK